MNNLKHHYLELRSSNPYRIVEEVETYKIKYPELIFDNAYIETDESSLTLVCHELKTEEEIAEELKREEEAQERLRALNTANAAARKVYQKQLLKDFEAAFDKVSQLKPSKEFEDLREKYKNDPTRNKPNK